LFAPQLDYLDLIGANVEPRIRSTNVLTQLHATLSGSGLCMLPAFVASGYPALAPVLPEQVSLTRSFHMHIHEDHRRAAHVREVAAFIAAEVERYHSLFHAPTSPPAAKHEDMRNNRRRSFAAQIPLTLGEYNFAGQYQQAPAPQGGGMVKAAWFRNYAANERPALFHP